MSENQTPVPPSQGFLLGNRMYDRLKFVVQVFLPALATLYVSLSQFWGFPNVEGVVGTITALALFLGLLIGLSTKNYTPPTGPVGTPVGNFVVSTNPETGSKAVKLDLHQDPESFIDNDVIAFHLVKEEVPVTVNEPREENLS